MSARPIAAVIFVLILAATASAIDAAQWAWLGVRIRDLSEQEMNEISSRHGLREGFGVFIVDVIEGTPARLEMLISIRSLCPAIALCARENIARP